jgi:hypothetical protein
MKNIIVIAGILLLASCSVLAQDASPLSDKGVGAFTSFAGSRSAGMGNAGLALIGNGYMNRLNPATWIGLENVQLTATYNFTGVSSIDNEINSSSYSANGNFGGGIFALPVDRSLGISLAGGFTPISSYKYQINAADSVPGLGGSAYAFDRTGSGGLGEGFVGASVSPIDGIGLGGMFQYAFGRTESVSSTTFDSTGFDNSYTDNSLYLHGPSGTLGIVLGSFDKLTKLSFLKGVTIAGYYKYPFNLGGTYEIKSIYSDGLDTTFSRSSSGYIPPEYGIGIGKVFDNGLGAVLDIRAQQLSKYRDSFTPVGTLKDALFIGGGIEYLQGRDIGSLFAKRVWRAGVYYNKTQFAVPTKSGEEKQLDEIFATAGIEMPLSYTATIDLAAQYGFRGLSSDLLLHERIFRLYVSITMGEGWFLPSTGE